MGQPPVCLLPPTSTLKRRGGHQTHRPGRAGSRLWMQRAEMGWSGGTPLQVPGGRAGPAWGGPGTEWRRCPRVPWGQEPLRGTAPSRAWGDCGSRMACHHIAVISFPCKTTQWLNIPSLYTRCSAEEDETRVLIYWYSRTWAYFKTNNFRYMKCIIYTYEIHTPSYAYFNSSWLISNLT